MAKGGRNQRFNIVFVIISVLGLTVRLDILLIKEEQIVGLAIWWYMEPWDLLRQQQKQKQYNSWFKKWKLFVKKDQK